MKSHVQLALAAAFLALSLSGCFGYPEGTVRPGDTVTVVFDATDPATGEALATQRTATFAVGSGASGLGVAVERRLVGHRANDTVSVQSRGDESRAFGGEASVDRHLPPFPVESTLTRAEFEANIGPPEVGDEFPLGGIYTARVVSFDEGNVTYRFVLDGEQANEFPAVGVVLMSRIEGGELTRTLDPMVDATFTIRPPSIFQPSTPLGLEPGSYRTLGADEDSILFAYSPGQDAALLVPDLDVRITIQSVQPAGRVTEPVDGNYGVRGSHQVNGDPTKVDLGAQPEAHPEGEGDHAH